MYYLSDYAFGFFLAKTLLSPQFLVEVAKWGKFLDHINALIIIEISIQPDNVWMSQSVVNFHFFLHLREKVILLQQMFVNDFKGNWFLCISLGSSKHFAKFAISNILNIFKILDCPWLLLRVERFLLEWCRVRIRNRWVFHILNL